MRRFLLVCARCGPARSRELPGTGGSIDGALCVCDVRARGKRDGERLAVVVCGVWCVGWVGMMCPDVLLYSILFANRWWDCV